MCRLQGLSFYVKCGMALVVCGLSVWLGACGGAGYGTSSLRGATVTVTIVLRDGDGSPTPALSAYTCGTWATNTTPVYSVNVVEGVYAKFVQNVDGNPLGVSGATAVATIWWPDGSRGSMTAMTSGDGLAVFFIDITQNLSAINGITLVTVSFYKDGIAPCVVDTTRAAYFTLLMPTPTPTSTSVPTPTVTVGATPQKP